MQQPDLPRLVWTLTPLLGTAVSGTVGLEVCELPCLEAGASSLSQSKSLLFVLACNPGARLEALEGSISMATQGAERSWPGSHWHKGECLPCHPVQKEEVQGDSLT